VVLGLGKVERSFFLSEEIENGKTRRVLAEELLTIKGKEGTGRRKRFYKEWELFVACTSKTSIIMISRTPIFSCGQILAQAASTFIFSIWRAFAGIES